MKENAIKRKPHPSRLRGRGVEVCGTHTLFLQTFIHDEECGILKMEIKIGGEERI